MSFKDVRDLAEHLKLLGFPAIFPLQALSTNFGSLGSFHIVAEILQWLAGLLEPGASLAGGVNTAEDRVLLVRSAIEFFVTKSAIKLNPRKLYVASAITAGELQKVTRLLIAPTQTEEDKDDEESVRSLNQIDIGDKIDDLRRARELSSDLTQRGATLHDLLAKEMVNKEARLAQTNRTMELSTVERALKNAISATQIKLQSTRAQLENARVEMNALSSKLQRKRAELERTKQRLEALQKIRPVHMQEFEECERELQDLFQKYFLRIHVRDALKAQFDVRTKRVTPVSSPILQKPADSSMPFIPDGLMEDDDDDEDANEAELASGSGLHRNFGLDAEIPDIRDEDLMLRNARRYQNSGSASTGKRPGTATSRIRPTTGRSRRKPGQSQEATERVSNMTNNRGGLIDDDDDDSSFGSSESDLDMGGIMNLTGRMPGGSTTVVGGSMASMAAEMGAIGDDDFDLNSIDDISISKITGELPLRPKTASKPDNHSDEDF